MHRCFRNQHCSRVKSPFVKVGEQEVSLEKDAIVFVRTVPVDGWVYVETQEGSEGYAPMNCLSPILPLVEQNTDDSRPSDAVVPCSNTQEIENVVCVKRRTNGSRSPSLRLSFAMFSSFIVSADKLPQEGVPAQRRIAPRLNLSIQNSQTDNVCVPSRIT